MNIVRLIAVLSLTFFSACSHVHITQPPGSALVRIGDYDSTHDSGAPGRWLHETQVAGYFAPYALMSLRVYGGAREPGERWANLMQLPGQKRLAAAWLADWKLAGAIDNPMPSDHQEGPLPCNAERSRLGCLFNLPGLALEIWVQRECREVVLAFRGTDFREFNDWLTNFHWFLRLLPINDQYEQTQDHAEALARQMAGYCRGKKPPLLTAVGHSLGGGLAQQAAFKVNGIDRVIAFDPSVVTGYHDIHIDARIADRDALKIDRVYEHGEILAYLRFFQRSFAPPTACNPQIRTVRFNAVKGNTVDQHSMTSITANLLEKAGTPAEWRQRTNRFKLPDGARGDPERCGKAT